MLEIKELSASKVQELLRMDYQLNATVDNFQSDSKKVKFLTRIQDADYQYEVTSKTIKRVIVGLIDFDVAKRIERFCEHLQDVLFHEIADHQNSFYEYDLFAKMNNELEEKVEHVQEVEECLPAEEVDATEEAKDSEELIIGPVFEKVEQPSLFDVPTKVIVNDSDDIIIAETIDNIKQEATTEEIGIKTQIETNEPIIALNEEIQEVVDEETGEIVDAEEKRVIRYVNDELEKDVYPFGDTFSADF